MVTVYAPNSNRMEFFKKLEQSLLELDNNKLVLLGDLNAVPTPELDRSTRKKEHKSRETTKIV